MFELTCHWDDREIESRKQRIRDVWNYRRVDHIPINFSVWSNPNEYTTWDYLKDAEKNLDIALNSLQKSIELIPDDYIPVLKPDKGYPIIAQIYGAPITWGYDPDQWPGIAVKLINSIDDMYKMTKPNVYEDGWGPELRTRIQMFRYVAKEKIYLTGYDIAGPLVIANDLTDTNLLLLSIKQNPEALHHLLKNLTETYNEFARMIVEAAGGLDNMTCVHWDTLWAPEGQKGYIADDIAAMISPDDYDIFCKPYNNIHFAEYGGGTIHNCGPHHMADRYLTHNPPVTAINIDYEKGVDEFEKIGRIFSGRGVVSVIFPDLRALTEGLPPADLMIDYHKKMIEAFLPGTIGIPTYFIDDAEYSDKEIVEIYHEMKKLSIDYANNLEWPNN
jgi:uroporphyrinogen-III decarboxylase